MPKKTTQAIIRSASNYIIGVKGNQHKLYDHVVELMDQKQHLSSSYIDLKRNKGRLELRDLSVSDRVEGIDKDWSGIRQIIKVRRVLKQEKCGKVSEQTGYYISSLPANALYYCAAIRSHWAIENSLHRVKDVVLKEDESKVKADKAPENISVLRNIAINIFRDNGYKSVAQAIRLVTNDIPTLLKLIC